MGEQEKQEVIYVKDTTHIASQPTHSCDSILLVVKDSLTRIEGQLRSQMEILENKYHRLKRYVNGAEEEFPQ